MLLVLDAAVDDSLDASLRSHAPGPAPGQLKHLLTDEGADFVGYLAPGHLRVLISTDCLGPDSISLFSHGPLIL